MTHKDHPITPSEARKLIALMVDQSRSQKDVAEKLGISPSYLGDILDGARPISDNVARKLGYSKVIMYEKIPHDDVPTA